MKILIILILACIIASLGSALFYLLRSQPGSPHTVRALTTRIALSIGLFLLLAAGMRLGWLQPHATLAPDHADARAPHDVTGDNPHRQRITQP